MSRLGLSKWSIDFADLSAVFGDNRLPPAAPGAYGVPAPNPPIKPTRFSELVFFYPLGSTALKLLTLPNLFASPRAGFDNPRLIPSPIPKLAL